ncbi:MAG: aspartate/tyrosine/aromatic aminotransferase [Rhodobacter sp.]|nr:aspartate/tyrosine/aromatic aminotransferase [Rhodobacter sp.]MCA3462619.1 aspartate/tyrosine/aromatic aminotransferase [Rhodobacter sp.]MCA3465168.1 aspartate/tyrosine/aromatic aminotransferase [Rhodobacter sp.]MCA3468714.1 aspartate/tyrosine/aromatic aminotransferase [Rhodobacter sp.]MCA3472422.1 aspartate/tyrosine/aromatic aminotransferase [Rhodobacter sp.]
MFDALKPQPQDKILKLIQMFRDDPRPGKIDLGVGVYKDATGLTPVMRAVRTAGKRLWESETSKTYTGLAGDPAFHAALSGVILGGSVPQDRIAAVATPGGTGAIRQALELIRLASPAARVWLSDPTWPNHPSIIRYLGIPMAWYRYFDAQTRGVDAEGMLADLGQVAAGDVVLLHGCCHNPTGANLTLAEWAAVADLLVARGAVPLIDLAYQGFGDGLEADAAPVRALAARCPEVLIAASCSKTFGIYRERTGLLIGLGTSAQRGLIQENLAFLNRQNYSFPPDHGARLVTLILEDPALTAIWTQELEEIRLNMLGLRQALAQELRRLTGSERWDFIARHRGMFSVLGATGAEVERLRAERGIYMVSDSRMNIAGLNAATVPVLARAIADIVA